MPLDDLTWVKNFPGGERVIVTPWYDENGIPHKYEGDCAFGNGVLIFTVAPPKSAEEQPECRINIFYSVVFTNEGATID